MSELKRGFGFWTILALLVTAMVGTGMFFGTSIGAARAGNAVILGWVIIIILSLYVAACFGELVALFPRAGGVYEFSKQAYGRFVSFLVGWITWLMSTVGMVVVIIAAIEYLFPTGAPALLGIDLKIIAAIGIIIFLNLIAFFGVDASAAALMIFAVVTVAVLLAIIVPGILKIEPASILLFFSKPGIVVFAAMFFMLEALMGWEEASFLAEETRNPKKIIPKALMISTLIAGLMTLAVAVVSLGIIPLKQLTAMSAPVQGVAAVLLGTTGAKLIGIGVIITLLGSAAGIVVSAPRLLMGMARDKLFISQLSDVHKKYNTPHKAILFQSLVAIILIIVTFGRYEELLSLFTPIALLVYIAVLIAVVVLRYKLPNVKRDFKVIFGKAGPVIVSLIYLAIVALWIWQEPGSISIITRILTLILFGIPIYLLLIFFYNPAAVMSFSNISARLSLWMENILLPKRIRKRIISVFQNLEQKSILEYGAGVGTLTVHLAEAVGPKGKIYATDLSKNNTAIVKKRLEKKGIEHVQVIHDQHQVNRVHPDVQGIDAVFSVGMLSYMQDLGKILKEINRLMPEGGHVFFVEYINFFKFLPNAQWVSDLEKLKKIFRENGFSVKLEKKKGIFWDYLFVYGLKSKQDVPMI